MAAAIPVITQAQLPPDHDAAQRDDARAGADFVRLGAACESQDSAFIAAARSRAQLFK